MNLSMAKYTRLLPRLFPVCSQFQLLSDHGEQIWQWPATEGEDEPSDPVVAWADFGSNIGRRTMPDGRTQFRSALLARDRGAIGWLVVSYDTSIAVPMDTAPKAMQRAFGDAASFMQEELELESECIQLASELTERYEELNLVYATDDRIEHIEDSQHALKQLVYNCADYLYVGMAALICRERNLEICELNHHDAPADPDGLLELLKAGIYDRAESQISPVVLNELDTQDRIRLLGDRQENLVAYPIIDDYGTAIGLLAVVAKQDMHTFSNGDRNLLEVMAKKASRIILTHHDSLTGLINRGGFESTLVTALNGTRSGNSEHCVLHIDIDQLHVVNDLMGHQEGDALIRRVARTLQGRLRDSDCLARLGGDEFGVLLTRCSLDQGFEIANKLIHAVRELEVISANRQLDVSASIGIALMSRETDGIVGLLAATEIACKSAKENGRNCIQVYEAENTTLVRRGQEIEWLGRVQMALNDDAFELYCQPVTPLVEGAHAGHFEILLRMLGDEGEILSPAVFMPAAERYQMMPMIDRWVIRNSLRLLSRKWESISGSEPVFCINLSGQSLTNTGFYSFVKEEIEMSTVPASNICFEITETAAISNIDEAITFMDGIREIGCRFSLDDFGAGLSSFGYLKKLPVQYLKIDGSFVCDLVSDEFSQSMVRAICDIGKTMKLSIVAEYVGDTQTADLLREYGVDFAQGFSIGKPAPIKKTLKALKAAPASASA